MRIVSIAAGLAVMLLQGCASYPPTPKLDHYQAGKGYLYGQIKDTQNSDSLFVVLTFSGGGTRAAALSYGVLEKLNGTWIPWEGKRVNLLDEVDVISSVSGGSFTAGYFTAFGKNIFIDREQPGFLQDFLYRDIQGELLGQLLYHPENWFRNRIDVAADFYDEEIFHHISYGDLLKRDRKPFLMVNATDMSLGTRFTFNQAQMDPMCVDLANFPLARAVAASSDFPVAFQPMTLDNYGGAACGYDAREPEWVTEAGKDLQANFERYKMALLFKTYQDKAKRPYVHLLDGGVVDNLGVGGPLHNLLSNDNGVLELQRKISDGTIKKLLIITVDAKSQADLTYDRSPSPPSSFDVLSLIPNVMIDNLSLDTVASLRRTFKSLDRDKAAYDSCQKALQQQCPGGRLPTPAPNIPSLDFIYVGFDVLANPVEREKFLNIETSFALPAKDIDDLRAVAKRLLDDSPTYRALQAGGM